MVSYYNNSFAMYQKSTNLSPYSSTPPSWYHPTYHAAAGGAAQFLAANGDASPQQLYYASHVFNQPSPDWPSHETFPPAGSGQGSYLQTSLGLHHHHHNHHGNVMTGGGGDLVGNHGGNLQPIATPPITVSDIPTPASSGPTASITPPTPIKLPSSKSPANFDWVKKSSYQTQPNPGKTRTKDKYRVVYSDHQRLELEKEFHYTRYITIRRKSELAQALQLSERQVKIWFQNRRAKDRKQKKKVDVNPGGQSMGLNTPTSASSASMSKYLDGNMKIEPLHLQHLHHPMGLGLHHSQYAPLHHPHNPSPNDALAHSQTVTSGPISMN